ncbi:3532_t:CDS:2, partial [Gigaspora rosea]
MVLEDYKKKYPLTNEFFKQIALLKNLCPGFLIKLQFNKDDTVTLTRDVTDLVQRALRKQKICNNEYLKIEELKEKPMKTQPELEKLNKISENLPILDIQTSSNANESGPSST